MSIMTVVFIVIVCFFIWRGYQKGFTNSFAPIASLILAYPAAIFLTTPLAKLIFANTTFSGMWVYFVSGSAIFFIVSFIVTTAVKGIARTVPVTPFTRKSSKASGTAIGMVLGVTLGLLAAYMINLIQTSKAFRSDTQASEQPFADQLLLSSAKTLVSTLASTAVQFALQDKTVTHITKAFAEDPQEMLGHIQNLSNDNNLKTLMSDEETQTLLKNGNTEALLKNWKFQHLMNNEDMQAILVNSDDTKDGKLSQQAAAEKMVDAWRRTDAIKNDPRVVSIISDPEFQQQLNSPNKIPLMMNAKLKELTDIIFGNDYKTAEEFTNEYLEEMAQKVQNTEKRATQKKNSFAEVEEESKREVIYRWTDSNGNVHYSDQPVKEQ